MVITIVGQVHSFSPQVPDVPYHNLNQSLVNASTVNSWGGGNSYSAFFFDQPDAFLQFGMPSPNNPKLMLAMISMIFSIAFFNYFGISVTKKMSAAHRMVLDSVRTCVVWAAGLMLFGEAFSFLQLIGFLILIAGTLVYNVIGPFRVPGLDYTAFDHPTDETDLHTQTFQALNVAIAARDFRRAATLQDELATLGRAGAGGSQGGLKAPLLNTQQQQQ
jgi:multidrug transporter EmrE-like cation transporter|eukprot:COSAG01_NODE_693_length_14202_cov_11.739491_7_plen_218_part_00